LAAGLVRLSDFSFPIKFSETTRAYLEGAASWESPQLAADIKSVISEKPDPASLSSLRAGMPSTPFLKLPAPRSIAVFSPENEWMKSRRRPGSSAGQTMAPKAARSAPFFGPRPWVQFMQGNAKQANWCNESAGLPTAGLPFLILKIS